ncbi:hypothetical protein F52700_10443 [Fusarium sp. NRRL 52700]|nr:hypothetical protein F52700_10443 [Fusarium sp. NRRL 52700]
MIKLRGPQSLTTAEIDLIAQHPWWFTTLDERERLVLSESRALRLLEEDSSDYEVHPKQVTQLDQYLTRHGQLQRMIDASKMMQRLWARQKADDEEAGLIAPTIEDKSHTWTEDLDTFARGCLKALSGETVDIDDDDMDESPSGTEHEEDTLLKEEGPVKDDVLSFIRAIMCGLVNELTDARQVLENRIREVTPEIRAIAMLQAPTHLARIVGVLDIEKDGKIDSYAEWKSLEKGFPTRYKDLWSDIDCLWPILADIRAWGFVSQRLQSIYRSELIYIPPDLIVIQRAVPASESG